jgi:molybdenum cofactor cytidylyltransferase
VTPQPRTPTGTVAVVLAAGAATRFGPGAPGPGGLAPKLLVPVGGRPLVLAPVLAALEAGCARVRLVVPAPDDALALVVAVATGADARVELVASPERADGLASSLAAGLAGLAADPAVEVVVVLLGDVPGVGADAIARVASAVAEGAPAARARHADAPGHPVAFARATLAGLDALAGDVGARELLAGLGAVEVDVEGVAPMDVDTPADLARLLASGPGPTPADGASPGGRAADEGSER